MNSYTILKKEWDRYMGRGTAPVISCAVKDLWLRLQGGREQVSHCVARVPRVVASGATRRGAGGERVLRCFQILKEYHHTLKGVLPPPVNLSNGF